MSEHGPAQRCDVWLFRTRLFKSRALAGQMVEKGAVRIDRGGKVQRLSNASSPVRVGDQLVIRRGEAPFRLVIHDLPDRRGPAVEAQACYRLASE